jgi:Bacteriophage replication gene A protein (GPA)
VIPLAARSEHFQQTTWAWRKPKFESFPAPIRDLALRRLTEIDRVDYVQANRVALQLSRKLATAHVGKAFDEQELRDCAENYARTCAALRPQNPHDVLGRLSGLWQPYVHACDGPVTWLPVRSPSYAAEMRAFAAKCAFAATVGVISIPANRANRFFGLSARLDDPLWWRRQLRKMWARKAEQAMRELGIVRKGADVYASESAVQLRADQQRRMRRFLERCVAVNEDGEAISLEQLAEHSLSNPALRNGELMARVRGFEEVAQHVGHQAIFVTLTCPSHFHPQLAAGGANPRYGTQANPTPTVQDAQQWLCKIWAQVRAAAAREGAVYYGFRVAEPHHDGTPHWHLLLFGAKHHLRAVSGIIHRCALSEFGSDPGAWEKRVHIEPIDPSRGSPAGYLAKYLAKNLTGSGAIGAQQAAETGVGAGTELGHGVGVAAGISRVLAWASVHGIRQFQQLGGPPVGLYREARRLRQSVPDADVERARQHADRGDWRGFCLAAGYRWSRDSADQKLEWLWRNEQRIRKRAGLPGRRRFKTHLRMVYAETGRRNRYGELTGSQTIGLKWSAAEIFTRPHQWRIESKGITDGTVYKNSTSDRPGMTPDPSSIRLPVPLGPVAITVRQDNGQVDPAERWRFRTQALIGQLACQYRLSERPKTQRKWRWDGDSSRIVPAYVHAETTGPPH